MMSRVMTGLAAALVLLGAAAVSGGAIAGGAPSAYEACDSQLHLYQQAQAGQASVAAGVARQFYEQCLKDHRYDGGEKRPPQHEHDCRRAGACS
jgi:hypothetical protein